MNSKFKKILFAILIILLAFQVVKVISADYTRNFALGGTYVCKELPFDIMSFDLNNSNKFIYYYGSKQAEDTGTFEKVSDGIYTLNSSIFKGEKLECYKEFPSESGFTVQINGVNCKFVQINSIPTQKGSTEPNGDTQL